MSPRGGSTRGRGVSETSATQRERRDAGPLTLKGQERRTAILRAARTVFERHGFVEARVADIVAEASVAQGTFYTYFDSKESVFTEVAYSVVESMLEALHVERKGNETPRERVRRGLQAFVEAFRPNAVMLGLTEQVGTFTPEMRVVRLKLREAFVERSAKGAQRFQDEGVADRSINPLLTAEVLGAMVDEVCHLWFVLGKDFDHDEVIDTMTSVWCRALGIAEAA